MIKVTNLQEVNHIENADLRMHIREKAETMMQEYQVKNLDDIGCFVILEQEEFTNFPISEMEFVEMLSLKENVFLHGVKIVGDSYGEDIYLPVGVVTC
mgnify:CR=1 FL=1